MDSLQIYRHATQTVALYEYLDTLCGTEFFKSKKFTQHFSREKKFREGCDAHIRHSLLARP